MIGLESREVRFTTKDLPIQDEKRKQLRHHDNKMHISALLISLAQIRTQKQIQITNIKTTSSCACALLSSLALAKLLVKFKCRSSQASPNWPTSWNAIV